MENIITPLENACTCGKTTDLKQCAGCYMQMYCCVEHQGLHYKTHKHVCRKIISARKEVLESEIAIKAAQPGYLDVEHGWEQPFIIAHLKKRVTLIEYFLEMDNKKAVEAALDHGIAVLKLARCDNVGLRSILPAVLMRLGKVKEAYAFCLWWICHYDFCFNWDNLTLPYLNIRDADPFETICAMGVEVPDYMRYPGSGFLKHMEQPDLSLMINMTLIKIRLLISVKNIQAHKSDQQALEVYVFYHHDNAIQKISRDSVLQIDETVLELGKHIEATYSMVIRQDPSFWKALLEPAEYLATEVPQRLDPGQWRIDVLPVRRLKIQHCYKAWKESPGAFDILASLVERFPTGTEPCSGSCNCDQH